MCIAPMRSYYICVNHGQVTSITGLCWLHMYQPTRAIFPLSRRIMIFDYELWCTLGQGCLPNDHSCFNIIARVPLFKFTYCRRQSETKEQYHLCTSGFVSYQRVMALHKCLSLTSTASPPWRFTWLLNQLKARDNWTWTVPKLNRSPLTACIWSKHP